MKRILITGTKKRSLGCFIGKVFHDEGWDVWLYSRSCLNKDENRWHERKCNITLEKDVKKLLNEIQNIDVSIQLADAGMGYHSLQELTESNINSMIGAKIIGSIILTKSLLKKARKQRKNIKLIWCCGKVSKKPEHLIIYSLINSGLLAYINELNRHYKKEFKAYYLPTTLILPSTLGNLYVKRWKIRKDIIESPSSITFKIKEIIQGKTQLGIIRTNKNIL